DGETARKPDEPHGPLREDGWRGVYPNATTRTSAATRTSRRARGSVTIRVPVDHRSARTRDPDSVAADATIELAAVLVLLEEGVEGVEERPAQLVEHGYRMTCSARPRSDGGIVSPSAFAVLRLMTNSNFVGCSTGRSARLAPLRILST